jgi:lysophospholipase L1-like esterase
MHFAASTKQPENKIIYTENNMKKLIKKITVVIITAAMLISALSLSAFAADKNYLVLGDSISAGYVPGGTYLTDQAFCNIIGAQRGYTVDNQAVTGSRTGDVLTKLSSGTLDEQIKNADLITLTIGGNDMMDVVYKATAALYNTHNPTSPITADMVTAILSDSSDSRYLSTLLALLASLKDIPSSQDFADEKALFANNLSNIVTYIRARNTKAAFIIETQYDPYKRAFGNALPEQIAAVTQGINELNAIITDPANGAGTKYAVAQTYTAFENSTDNLCNASLSPISVDFHPNIAGHAVIAQTMMDALDTYIYFDYMMPDGTAQRVAAVKNSNVTLSCPQAFSREGYTQTGWTDVQGGEKKYDIGQTMVAGASMTLYPVWSKNAEPEKKASIADTNDSSMPFAFAGITGVAALSSFGIFRRRKRSGI